MSNDYASRETGPRQRIRLPLTFAALRHRARDISPWQEATIRIQILLIIDHTALAQPPLAGRHPAARFEAAYRLLL